MNIDERLSALELLTGRGMPDMAAHAKLGEAIDALTKRVKELEMTVKLAITIHRCHIGDLRLRSGDRVVITEPHDATPEERSIVEEFLPAGVKILWRTPGGEIGVLRVEVDYEKLGRP